MQSDRTDQMTRAGLNLIGQALSIYDASLTLVLCNRPFQGMFQLPQALVTPGAKFADTIRFLVDRGEYGDVLDPEGFVAARVEQAQAFQPHYMERLRANGRTISVEGSPLPGGGWVTVYTDITAIKSQEALLRTRSEELSDQLLDRAEQVDQTNRELAVTIAQLEEAKRGLALMEARTRLTTEMMPAHIARLDKDGVYTFTNRRLSTILPGRDSDILGQHYTQALGTEVAARLKPRFEDALQGKPCVLEFTDADSTRRIRTAITPDTAADRSVTGIYVLSTDVTEEVQARAALTQTHKRELAAQISSGLAHDFANLLTIILGLQSRMDRLDLDEDGREIVQATKAAARRGGALLDKIAAISGPGDVQAAAVDLDAFFASFAPLARAPLPQGIEISFEVSVSQPGLLLDPGSLQDSLLNLVLNARDAIGAGPGQIAVRARDVRETWLEIAVEDTGPGFSEAALVAALDPFFTTKGASGSGLGLSMVYDHTKLAGGQVKLANTAQGARVVLRLPLRPIDLQQPALRVLLVEDDADLRATTRDALMGLGHQVVEAASAEEALALAGLEGLNWVLSDINLAGEMSGVALCEGLAMAQPHLRLALMTALPVGDGLRQRGAARWPVLSKPVHSGTLSALLAEQAVA